MTTTLNGGRGWASDEAAASIHRMDRQLARLVQITEAGRSVEAADANYRAWVSYQNGGPWAPRALPGSESVHCKGNATDSNDSAAPWWANGWRETARSNDPDEDEPMAPLHDEFSHGADMYRYIGQAVDLMRNEAKDDFEMPPPPDWRT